MGLFFLHLFPPATMCPVPSPSYPYSTEVLDPSRRSARRSELRSKVQNRHRSGSRTSAMGRSPSALGSEGIVHTPIGQHCKPRAGQQPPETSTSALPSPARLLRATWRERSVLARQRGVAQDAANRRSSVHLSRQQEHTSGAGHHGRAPGSGQAYGDKPRQVRPRAPAPATGLPSRLIGATKVASQQRASPRAAAP